MAARKAAGDVAGRSGAVVSGYSGPPGGHYTSVSTVPAALARCDLGTPLRGVPRHKAIDWAFELTWQEADAPS